MATRWTKWSKWYSRIWRMKFRIWSFLFENFCWWIIPMTSSMVVSKRVVENTLWSYYLKTRWKFPYFQLWRMLISEFPMSYLACIFTEDYPEVRKLTLRHRYDSSTKKNRKRNFKCEISYAICENIIYFIASISWPFTKIKFGHENRDGILKKSLTWWKKPKTYWHCRQHLKTGTLIKSLT